MKRKKKAVPQRRHVWLGGMGPGRQQCERCLRVRAREGARWAYLVGGAWSLVMPRCK